MEDVILSLLADGQYHSGDKLGGVLGISRAAVWKRLQKLEALGLPVKSVRGKGYCIEGGIDLLAREVIVRGLSDEAAALVAELELVGQTESTNKLALAKAVGGQVGYVCSAEQQTAGRGRRGRRWVSPFGANLYVSAVWEFAGGAMALEGLSLAVGVAVVEALAAVGVGDVSLKWPNDVLHGGNKLAGVLVEMVGDAAGPCQVVVGIGINVAMPPRLPEVIDQPWTDLRTAAGRPLVRSEVLAVLLNELMPLLASFEQYGFAHYRERWQQLDAWRGRDVFVHVGDTVAAGVAAGVDASGALVLDTDAGRRSFSGGEVSLRSAG